MVVTIDVAALMSVTAIIAGPINATITVTVRLIVVIIIPVSLLLVVVVVVGTIISVTFAIAISDYYCFFFVTFCDFFWKFEKVWRFWLLGLSMQILQGFFKHVRSHL